jgi:hypothetical protein
MADDMKPLPAVYTAIASVMRDVGQEGISKDRKNQQQGYSFRGIDDVYNALAPILARHQLIIVPRVLTREKTEQTTARGGLLFYVVVHVEFEIVCAVDGSHITASTYGEAMDSADKATNKAMSAAYKYMAMQTFCIPTEGDNDADAHSHELAARGRPTSHPVSRGNSAPEDAGQHETPRGSPSQTMSKGDARPEYAALQEGIRTANTTAELGEWGKMNAKRVALLPDDWRNQLRAQYSDMMDGLKHVESVDAEANEDFQERN